MEHGSWGGLEYKRVTSERMTGVSFKAPKGERKRKYDRVWHAPSLNNLGTSDRTWGKGHLLASRALCGSDCLIGFLFPLAQRAPIGGVDTRFLGLSEIGPVHDRTMDPERRQGLEE